MRILQYTLGLSPYRRGGLPRYSTDLSLELAKNNKVTLLYPGKMYFINSDKIIFKSKKSKYPFKVVEMENPLPVSLGLGINESAPYMQKRSKKNIINFLKKLSPDVIHIHTFMGLPKEFLEVAKKLNIKTIYTTHDFYGLCPKMLSKNPIKNLKERKCTYDCMLCKNGPSLNKIKIMQSHMYMHLKEKSFVKKIRKKQKAEISNSTNGEKEIISSIQEIKARYLLRIYYQEMFNLITEFHFNSSVSEKYIRTFLPKVQGKVLNITHTGLSNKKSKKKKFTSNIIKLGYVGPYDEKKGFFLLCDVLKKLRNYHSNFEIHFYGDILNNSFFDKKWVFNHGILSSDQMYSAYENIDVLIMPSLWHETFGFSVLEALSYGDVCLVSKNVGAKDLIMPTNIFNTKSDLFNILNKMMSSPSDVLNKMSLSKELPLNFAKHVKSLMDTFYK